MVDLKCPETTLWVLEVPTWLVGRGDFEATHVGFGVYNKKKNSGKRVEKNPRSSKNPEDVFFCCFKFWFFVGATK